MLALVAGGVAGWILSISIAGTAVRRALMLVGKGATIYFTTA